MSLEHKCLIKLEYGTMIHSSVEKSYFHSMKLLASSFFSQKSHKTATKWKLDKMDFSTFTTSPVENPNGKLLVERDLLHVQYFIFYGLDYILRIWFFNLYESSKPFKILNLLTCQDKCVWNLISTLWSPGSWKFDPTKKLYKP